MDTAAAYHICGQLHMWCGMVLCLCGLLSLTVHSISGTPLHRKVFPSPRWSHNPPSYPPPYPKRFRPWLDKFEEELLAGAYSGDGPIDHWNSIVPVIKSSSVQIPSDAYFTRSPSSDDVFPRISKPFPSIIDTEMDTSDILVETSISRSSLEFEGPSSLLNTFIFKPSPPEESLDITPTPTIETSSTVVTSAYDLSASWSELESLELVSSMSSRQALSESSSEIFALVTAISATHIYRENEDNYFTVPSTTLSEESSSIMASNTIDVSKRYPSVLLQSSYLDTFDTISILMETSYPNTGADETFLTSLSSQFHSDSYIYQTLSSDISEYFDEISTPVHPFASNLIIPSISEIATQPYLTFTEEFSITDSTTANESQYDINSTLDEVFFESMNVYTSINLLTPHRTFFLSNVETTVTIIDNNHKPFTYVIPTLTVMGTTFINATETQSNYIDDFILVSSTQISQNENLDDQSNFAHTMSSDSELFKTVIRNSILDDIYDSMDNLISVDENTSLLNSQISENTFPNEISKTQAISQTLLHSSIINQSISNVYETFSSHDDILAFVTSPYTDDFTLSATYISPYIRPNTSILKEDIYNLSEWETSNDLISSSFTSVEEFETTQHSNETQKLHTFSHSPIHQTLNSSSYSSDLSYKTTDLDSFINLEQESSFSFYEDDSLDNELHTLQTKEIGKINSTIQLQVSVKSEMPIETFNTLTTIPSTVGDSTANDVETITHHVTVRSVSGTFNYDSLEESFTEYLTTKLLSPTENFQDTLFESFSSEPHIIETIGLTSQQDLENIPSSWLNKQSSISNEYQIERTNQIYTDLDSFDSGVIHSSYSSSNFLQSSLKITSSEFIVTHVFETMSNYQFSHITESPTSISSDSTSHVKQITRVIEPLSTYEYHETEYIDTYSMYSFDSETAKQTEEREIPTQNILSSSYSSLVSSFDDLSSEYYSSYYITETSVQFPEYIPTISSFNLDSLITNSYFEVASESIMKSIVERSVDLLSDISLKTTDSLQFSIGQDINTINHKSHVEYDTDSLIDNKLTPSFLQPTYTIEMTPVPSDVASEFVTKIPDLSYSRYHESTKVTEIETEQISEENFEVDNQKKSGSQSDSLHDEHLSYFSTLTPTLTYTEFLNKTSTDDLTLGTEYLFSASQQFISSPHEIQTTKESSTTSSKTQFIISTLSILSSEVQLQSSQSYQMSINSTDLEQKATDETDTLYFSSLYFETNMSPEFSESSIVSPTRSLPILLSTILEESENIETEHKSHKTFSEFLKSSFQSNETTSIMPSFRVNTSVVEIRSLNHTATKRKDPLSIESDYTQLKTSSTIPKSSFPVAHSSTPTLGTSLSSFRRPTDPKSIESEAPNRRHSSSLTSSKSTNVLLVPTATYSKVEYPMSIESDGPKLISHPVSSIIVSTTLLTVKPRFDTSTLMSSKRKDPKSIESDHPKSKTYSSSIKSFKPSSTTNLESWRTITKYPLGFSSYITGTKAMYFSITRTTELDAVSTPVWTSRFDDTLISVQAVSSFLNQAKNTSLSNTTKESLGINASLRPDEEWPPPTMDTTLMKNNHYWILTVLEAPEKGELPQNFSHTMELRLANAYSEAFQIRASKIDAKSPDDLVVVKILTLTNDILLRQLEMVYVVEKGGSLVPSNVAAEYLNLLRFEQLREFLGHHAIVKARPYQPDGKSSEPVGSPLPVLAIVGGILGALFLLFCCFCIYCRCCRPKPAPPSPGSSASASLQRSLSKYGQHNRKHLFQEMTHQLTSEMAAQIKHGSTAPDTYLAEKTGRSLPTLPRESSGTQKDDNYEKSMKILKILENKDASTSPILGKQTKGTTDSSDTTITDKKKHPKQKKRRKLPETQEQSSKSVAPGERSASETRQGESPPPTPPPKLGISSTTGEDRSSDSGTSSRHSSSKTSSPSDKGIEEIESEGSNVELLPPLQELIDHSKSESEAAVVETQQHLSRVRQRISDLIEDAFALAGGRKLYGSLRSKKIEPTGDIFSRASSFRSHSAEAGQHPSDVTLEQRPISEGGERLLGALTDNGQLITHPPPKLVWDESYASQNIERPLKEIAEACNRHINFFPFNQQRIGHLPTVPYSSSLPVLDTLPEAGQDTTAPLTATLNVLREASSELYLAHSSRINPAVIDQYDEIDIVSALRNGEPVEALIQAIKDELQKFNVSQPKSNENESNA